MKCRIKKGSVREYIEIARYTYRNISRVCRK